jgi:hypothetical protein
MHFFPIRIPEEVTVTALQTYGWRSEPRAMSAQAVPAEGEILLITSMERPIEFTIPRSPNSMEALHVERFRSDCISRGEGDPIETISYSSDPPDFLVNMSEHGRIGLECTRLAFETQQIEHDNVRRSKTLSYLFALWALRS